MTTVAGILGFSSSEIERLYAPENKGALDHVIRAVGMLHDLVTRYSGSMFLVMIPEEDSAVEMFCESLERLRGIEPFYSRMAENFEAYRRIKMMFDEQGPTEQVFERAKAMTDEIVELWTAVTRYNEMFAAHD